MKDNWDQDALWELLGQARAVSVSPYFSRKVLREIRRTPDRPLLPLFLLRWLGAGALAVLTVGFFLNLNESADTHLARSADFTEIFDVAAGLDTLVAVEEVSLSNYAAGL